MKNRFTVITVCYNAEKEIAETIESVIKQTYQSLEYIIVDGGSKDKTLDIINQFGSNYPIKIMSREDDGIYNAMNRGISVSSGEYINFLNAGDTYYSCETLENVSKSISKTSADIYYGKALYMENQGRAQYIREAPEVSKMLEYLWKGYMPNHQTIFAKKQTLREHYFNESYRIVADFDWFLKCYREGKRMEYMDELLIRYSREGISSDRRIHNKLEQEHEQVLAKNFPIKYLIKRYLK